MWRMRDRCQVSSVFSLHLTLYFLDMLWTSKKGFPTNICRNNVANSFKCLFFDHFAFVVNILFPILILTRPLDDNWSPRFCQTGTQNTATKETLRPTKTKHLFMYSSKKGQKMRPLKFNGFSAAKVFLNFVIKPFLENPIARPKWLSNTHACLHQSCLLDDTECISYLDKFNLI